MLGHEMLRFRAHGRIRPRGQAGDRPAGDLRPVDVQAPRQVRCRRVPRIAHRRAHRQAAEKAPGLAEQRRLLGVEPQQVVQAARRGPPLEPVDEPLPARGGEVPSGVCGRQIQSIGMKLVKPWCTLLWP